MVVDVGSILPSRWWCASELQLSCIWSLMLMLVGSVASERTGMVMCPLLHFSFKVGLLAWSSILQWNVLVVLTTYMPEGSGADWGPAGRMGKLIPGTHIISRQDEFLLLTGWKRLRVINLLSSSCLISGGYGGVSGHLVGLCFSQVGHSATAIATSSPREREIMLLGVITLMMAAW